MKKNYWKLRYTLMMVYHTAFVVSPSTAWIWAEEYYNDFGCDISPADAVSDEISCL